MSPIEPHSFRSKGPDLSSVLAGSSTWERTVVPIGPAFRWMLWGTTVVLTLTSIWRFLGQPVGPTAAPGFFLFGWPWCVHLLEWIEIAGWGFLLLGSVLLALAALTSGFSFGGRRLQLALGVVAAAGGAFLALPLGLLLLTVANLVVWAVLIAAVVAIALMLLVALLSG